MTSDLKSRITVEVSLTSRMNVSDSHSTTLRGERKRAGQEERWDGVKRTRQHTNYISLTVQVKCFEVSKLLIKTLILLFSKDALACSKVTIKTFIMLKDF